jgi:hypothetical protein
LWDQDTAQFVYKWRPYAHLFRRTIYGEYTESTDNIATQTKRPDLADLVEQSYKSSTTKTADQFEELWALFTSMVREQAVACVIDGLDECQDRGEDGNLERSTFTHRLVKLVQDQSSN